MSIDVRSSRAIHILRAALLALAGSVAAWAATAQQAYFSGPSVVKLQTTAAFSGKGFAPNAALNVTLKTPAGTTAVYGVVTGPDGSVKYSLVPTQAGPYQLSVTDSSGHTLASAVTAAMR